MAKQGHRQGGEQANQRGDQQGETSPAHQDRDEDGASVTARVRKTWPYCDRE
jgi:hypothetical protein